jgi:hypothetical protein
MKKEEDTTLEKKKWYQNMRAMLALVSAIVAAIIGLQQFWKVFIPSSNDLVKTLNNTIIVLDKSAAMAAPFDGSNKFEIARNTLLKRTLVKVAQNDNLALRLFGGPCFENESSKLAVKFGQKNEEKVEKELAKIKDLDLKGETTLVSAVIDAIGDFNPPELFQDVNTNVIIIAGRFDSCPGASIADIEERLKDTKIKMSIQIVGMRIPRNQESSFAEIARVTGGKADFVNTREELELLLDKSDLSNVYFKAKQFYDLQQDEKAEPLFQQAASQNISEAMLYLGKMYSDSLGVLKDYKKAADWLLKAAQAGNAEAMTLLGVMHYYGQGVAPDAKQAVSWFTKAAEAGDNEGMYNLAAMYEHGRGVEKEDDEKAVEWYRKAAERGHEGARKRLEQLTSK